MGPLRFCSLLFHITNLSGCGDPSIKHVNAASLDAKKVRTREGVYGQPLARKEAVRLPDHPGTKGPAVPKADYGGVKGDIENRVKLLDSVEPSDELGKAKIFYTVYLKLLNELILAESKTHSDIDPSCPPETMEVSFNGRTLTVNLGRNIAHGSSSLVYESTPVESLGNTKFIIKSLAPLPRDGQKVSPSQTLSAKTKLALLEDEALMIAFKDADNLVPHTYIWKADGIDSYCHARTIVSENVGATELGDLPEPIRKNPAVLYSIAARALEIIQELHRSGLIHGDIHKRNWLVGDVKNPAKTLRMIDFGRVDLFIQPDPENPRSTIPIPDNAPLNPGKSSWNPRLLSPWEIQGHRPTRRDDIFRIAEMLVVLAGDSNFSTAANGLRNKYRGKNYPMYLKGIVDLKLNRDFDDSVPQKIRDFYQHALRMRYLNNFNYQRWIQIFRDAAEK